jgi:hypothetical protein
VGVLPRQLPTPYLAADEQLDALQLRLQVLHVKVNAHKVPLSAPNLYCGISM